MHLIGPLQTNKSLNLICFEENELTIINLGIKASLIFSLNHQLPFLYSNYFQNLLETPIQDLKNTFKTKTFKKNEIESLEIQKSKLWAHKIILQTKEKELKFAIQKREEVEHYVEIIEDWKSSKLS